MQTLKLPDRKRKTPRRRAEPRYKGEAQRDSAAFTLSEDIAHLGTFQRSERYRVRILLRERGDSRYVACVGEMLSTQGSWIGARSFNFRRDELHVLVEALERAKAILAVSA